MARRERDAVVTPDETIKMARGIGVACLVAVAIWVAVAISAWPIAIYGDSPWAATAIESALFFAWAAWLCLTPPYHGILVGPAGLIAAFAFYNANAAAMTERTAWPVAAGALIFTAGGLLVMLVSKISTEKSFRRSYWQEAWSGAVVAVLGLIAAAILNASLPEPRCPRRHPARRELIGCAAG